MFPVPPNGACGLLGCPSLEQGNSYWSALAHSGWNELGWLLHAALVEGFLLSSGMLLFVQFLRMVFVGCLVVLVPVAFLVDGAV